MMDSVLRRLGVHPRQFRLLVSLFHTLSERKELLNQQLGFNERSLTGGALLFGVLGGIVAIVLLIGKTSSDAYLAAFLFLTTFVLVSVLMAETANTLVNPEEGLVLVHQPIGGATYTAAKLVHLGRVVSYFVFGLNLVPALLGYAVTGASIFYPLEHLAAALAVGTGIAFACCALFGWLMRFIPPARMKTAAQVVSALSYLIVMPQFRVLHHLQELWARLPATGAWGQAAAIAALLVATALGLRALSADYLIRVTRMVQGGSRKRSAGTRDRGLFALPGKAVARWLGGPQARAGFAYTARMIARDWQFRRQIFGFLPTLVIAVAATRSFDDPFGTTFSTVHLLPHTIGLMAFFTCSILEAGSSPKAVWIFDIAPAGALPRFASGVYAALWSILVLAPHLLAIPAMLWFWPVADAAAFAAFGMATVSLYLSLSLMVVDGLPFGHKPEPSQAASMLGVLMGGGVAAAIVVGIQYYYVFRSHAGVVLASMIVSALAAWFGRRSVSGLAIAIRHYLNTLSAEKSALYQEVQT